MDKKIKGAAQEGSVQEQLKEEHKLLSKLINMNFEESEIIITVNYLDH